MAHRAGHRDDRLKVTVAKPRQTLKVTTARPVPLRIGRSNKFVAPAQPRPISSEGRRIQNLEREASKRTSFTDRLRDVFDANTAKDRLNRITQGRREYHDRNLLGEVFEFTNKARTSVDALTGHLDRQGMELDQKLRNKEITLDQYRRENERLQGVSEFAGTDPSLKSRLGTSFAVGAGAATELYPIGLLARIPAKGVASVGLKHIGKLPFNKTVKIVGKKSTGQLAKDGAKFGALEGGVQGLAASLQGDNRSLGRTAQSVLIGGTLGGVVGGAAGGVAGAVNAAARVKSKSRAAQALNVRLEGKSPAEVANILEGELKGLDDTQLNTIVNRLKSGEPAEDVINNAVLQNNDALRRFSREAADTVFHVPGTNTFARLSLDQYQILKNELQNIPVGSGDVPHLSPLSSAQKSGLEELPIGELARQSENARLALANVGVGASADAPTVKIAPTQVDEVPQALDDVAVRAEETAPVAAEGASQATPTSLTTPARAADTPKGPIGRAEGSRGLRVERTSSLADELAKKRIKVKPATEVKTEVLSEISAKSGISRDVLIREARRKGLTISQLEAEAAQISDSPFPNKDALFTKILNDKYGSRGERLNGGVPRTTDLEEQRLQQAIAEGRGPDIPDGVDPVTGEISQNLNEVDIRLREAIEAAAREVDELDSQIKEAGLDPNDVRRKMQLAERGEYDLTPIEEQAADLITNRLNQARQTLEDAGVSFDGVRAFYTPQVRQGDSLIPKSREDLLDFGYSKHRTNAIDIDEMNHGPDPLIDYIVRSENRELLTEKVVTDAARIDGRAVSPESAKAAAKELESIKAKINDKAQSAGVLTNDTVGDFAKVGELEGYKKRSIDFEPGAISQEPKDMMERAGVWESGFMQYDNSVGYASEFTRLAEQAGLSPDEVRPALTEYIKDIMPDAEDSAITAATDYVERVMAGRNIPIDRATGLVTRAIKNVAKSEIVRLAKTTEFTGNKMKKVVNEQINGRLLEDAYNRNFAQKLDQWLSERINVSLRGANVVSALFELGDVANIGAKYGYKDMPRTKFGLGKIDGDRFALSNKYGENNPHFMSEDIPEVSKFDEIMGDKNLSLAQKITRLYKTAENKLLAFRYVEQMKTELFFRQADDFYRQRGLRGKELVDAVMEDYHNTMLPTKLATANRILGKLPRALTQYLNWGLQATKRMGRTLSGTDAGGKFQDMTKAGRIARGIGTEIAPKVIGASILGVPIMQVMGIRDFTGATEGDFTGISDEDKNTLDHVVNYLALSPALGFASEFYYADRRNDIARERAAAGETFNAQERPEDTARSVAEGAAKRLVPFMTQIDKSRKVLEARDRGFYENRDGRIQASGPEGLGLVQGLITGKNYTPTMREFQDNPDLLKVISGEAKLQDLITKNETVSNVAQFFGGRTRDFQRPLSSDITDKNGNQVLPGYNSRAKEAIASAERLHGKGSPQVKRVINDWIKDGREYNALYDDLTRNNPDVFEKWIAVRGEDVITPEKWRVYQGDSRLFEYDKSRKLMEAKHLGRDIDPIYEIPSEQAKLVLQERSAYTGDDMRQRTFLYQTDWYSDFKKAEADYYGGFTSSFDTSGKSERYKEWRQLSDLAFSPDSELLARHPLVAQSREIIDKYGFGSDESDAWFKANSDAYRKQKDAYDDERLQIINRMRAIEGVEPLSKKQFTAKIEFEDDETGGFYGGSRRGRSRGVKIKSPKVQISKKALPKSFKLKSKSVTDDAAKLASIGKKVKVKSRKPSAGGKIKIKRIA